MRWAEVVTPLGPVSVATADDAVCRVGLNVALAGDGSPAVARDLVLRAAVTQLRGYFAGERSDFDLPWVLPAGVGSAFDRAVWGALAAIPFGEQRTYGAVAAGLGQPGAARAVGTACHRNPLPLLLPCHRVVGAGGKLVGFGAGLAWKRWLLEHEARMSLLRAWA